MTILKLLKIRDQYHVLHWQTESHALHVALGDYYEEFLGIVDEFVESYVGVFGRFSIDGGAAKITLYDISACDVGVFTDQVLTFLEGDLRDAAMDDNGLNNLIDDMVSLTEKLKYLLTLN